MSLEILSRHPPDSDSSMPLLFVHGAYVAAWCWDEYFLPYFAGHGYEAHAVSLRCHGRSKCTGLLDMASVDDYAEDVRTVAARLDRPVLIGHSMGANVVQRAARAANARALVLLAPVPPQGLGTSAWSLATRDPALFAGLFAMQIGRMAGPELLRVRDYLFSKSVTEADALRYLIRMRRESQRALTDLSWPQHFWLRGSVGLPALVIGAENDAFFPRSMIEEAARFHGIAPVIFPDMAHAMMLEPGWQGVADRVLEFLAEQRLDD